MKVSVAMVTFEHELWIAQAIESVLAQELPEVELVVGEDGSRDRTRAIVQGYADRFPRRVRLLPARGHLGIMPNWLRTLAECRGEYLAMLDGDDFWTDPAKLRKQVALLDAAPELALSLHVCREVYEGGARPPHDSPGRPPRPRYELADLVRGPLANSSTLVCRRRVLDELPTWFIDVAVGDWALQVLSARRGGIGFLPGVMSQHRNHARGMFAGRSRARQRQMLVETRRMLIPLLPPPVAAVAREAEFHDTLQQGRAHERAGEYREALDCYARCREHLDDAGGTSRWQLYRRMLRARAGAVLAGRRVASPAGAPEPRTATSEASASGAPRPPA